MKEYFWKFFLLKLILFIQICHGVRLSEYYKQRDFQCRPIKEKLCMGIGYNYTTMPNIMGNENQKEASRRLREFQPLVDYQYSEKFHFFLCTLFFPMCTGEVNIGIPACRPLCEDMRKERAPIMRTFGFEWSDSIDCSKLPWKSAKDHLCIPHPSYMDDENKDHKSNNNKDNHKSNKKPHRKWTQIDEADDVIDSTLNDDEANGEKEEKPSRKETELSNDQNNPISHIKESSLTDNDRDNDADDYVLTRDDDNPSFESDDDQFNPSSPLSEEETKETDLILCSNPGKFVYVERDSSCVPRCGPNVDVIYKSRDKSLAYLVLSAASLLCFVATFFTVATFLIDSRRFRYPERPIIFVAVCYGLYSIGYLMRTVKGYHSPISCIHNESMSTNHTITSGFKDTSCYASFFFLYFFHMAGSVWWVILNLAWLLSAAFKWGHEAIEAVGFYFHVVAWSVPGLQTIGVMLLGKVDGDELTGLCNVGNLDPDSLMYYVIIPLALYLLIGTVTLLFGFIYMFKIRRVIKRNYGEEYANLEKLMLKIGVFSILYAVPMACVIAAYFYQYQNFHHWMNVAEKTECLFYNPQDGAAKQIYSLNRHQRSGFAASQNYQQDDADYFSKIKNPNSIYPDPSFHSNVLSSTTEEKSFIYTKKKSYSNYNEYIENEMNCLLPHSIPSASIFICKIIMSLIPGILTGMWIGSIKTLYSWVRFCTSCGFRKTPGSEANPTQKFQNRLHNQLKLPQQQRKERNKSLQLSDDNSLILNSQSQLSSNNASYNEQLNYFYVLDENPHSCMLNNSRKDEIAASPSLFAWLGSPRSVGCNNNLTTDASLPSRQTFNRTDPCSFSGVKPYRR